MKNKKIKKKFSFYKHPAAVVLLLAFFMTAFFVMSQSISAQSVGTQINQGLNYATVAGLGTRDIREVIFLIISILLGFLGIVAVILIMYAGFVWMTAGGDSAKIEKAKAILKNAVIGLIIIFASWSIAAFIVRMLANVSGPGDGKQGSPPNPCVGCEAFGSGIIESVYPAPGERDVARDTVIFVTFKVLMKLDTIISTSKKISDNIKISYRDPQTNKDVELDRQKVDARTVDNKTFIFDPIEYLGDGIHSIWHTVSLGDGIQKEGGHPAFGALGSREKFRSWSFEVGTRLDLTPPQWTDVFPYPDFAPDTYDNISAQQAQWTFTTLRNPEPAQSASIFNIQTKAGSVDIDNTKLGNYSCQEDADVVITQENNNYQVQVFNSFPKEPNLNKNPIFISSAKRIDLGCGVALVFINTPLPGSQWSFSLKGARPADTVRINQKTYEFSQGESVSSIVKKINEEQAVLGVQAEFDKNVLKIIALQAGSKPNDYIVLNSGWAEVSFKAGTDAQSERTGDSGLSDQPKNVIIRIDFSESMLPSAIAGRAETDNSGGAIGVGKLLNLNNPPFITIQADWNDKNGFEENEYVAGVFEISNLYKTVEFHSSEECGQKNSCGDTIYCLPAREKGATRYKVTVKAAMLQECDNNNKKCIDPNYNQCNEYEGKNVCQNNEDINYPKAGVEDGAVDAANNSFDGNNNKNAQGPVSVYRLNVPDRDDGDSMSWEFYINNRVDLSAPVIEDIGPNIQEQRVNVTIRPEARFGKILMSSTLKPNSGYRDGLCSCNNDKDCGEGEHCNTKTEPFQCESIEGRRQQFCETNNECASKQCLNRSYVTLIDNACTTNSGRCVGWWIENTGVDSSSPIDGFSDKTKVFISHTPFNQLKQYGADMGSGIKDIYQNCYLPSSGPNAAGGECAGAPYCCDGEPSDKECK